MKRSFALFVACTLSSSAAVAAGDFFPVRDVGGVLITHTPEEAKKVVDGAFKNVVWKKPTYDELNGMYTHKGSNEDKPDGPVVAVTIKTDEKGKTWLFERVVILYQPPLPHPHHILEEARKKYGKTYQHQPNLHVLYTEGANGQPPNGINDGCLGVTTTTFKNSCRWILDISASTSSYSNGIHITSMLMAPQVALDALQRSKPAAKAAEDAKNAERQKQYEKAVSGAKL